MWARLAFRSAGTRQRGSQLAPLIDDRQRWAAILSMGSLISLAMGVKWGKLGPYHPHATCLNLLFTELGSQCLTHVTVGGGRKALPWGLLMKIHTIQKEVIQSGEISQNFTEMEVDVTVKMDIHKIVLIIIDHMFHLMMRVPLKERAFILVYNDFQQVGPILEFHDL